MLRVFMSGGGTAGHVYPALAVARLLESEHDEVAFIGTPQGLESTLVPRAGFEFISLPSSGFDRARPFSAVTAAFTVLRSVAKALALLRARRPDVVIGFGGYVSMPVGLAAVLLRIPLVLHEQNSVAGLTNRVLSRWAAAVALTYPDSGGRLHHAASVVECGNPVRDGVLTADRAGGRRAHGLTEDAVVLLVFGGSRGARHINSAIVGIADRLMALPDVHVVHVTGAGEYETVVRALDDAGMKSEPRWTVEPYLDDLVSVLASCDLVVARAGATSIAEITALGVAAVLVPYPYATDDHQTGNASCMGEVGGAVVVRDADLDSTRFGDELLALLADPARRATMAAASKSLGRPDAAACVVSLARGVARHSDVDPT